MLSRRLLSTAAVAVGLLASASAASAQTIEVGHIPECTEAVPAAVSAPGGANIPLHVHVVLDGVTLEDGVRAFEDVRRAYEPLGIDIFTSFATATTAEIESERLIAELRKMFGGARPPWAHLVYLLTSKDMTSAGPAGSGVAGQADCIGGVYSDVTAFAVGEFEPEDPENDALLSMHDFSAKVAAHELGHLLGAHHHYANCVQGAADGDGDISACTLMFNDVGLVSLGFSVVNGPIVRGHADLYAKPVTAAAPADGQPVAPLPPSPCEPLAYRDPPGDHAALVVNNPEDIDLVAGSFHTTVEGGREVVRFRWQVASLDDDIAPASRVRYRVDITGPRGLRLQAEWDGSQAIGRVLDGDTEIMTVPARVATGPNGHIEAELPLAQLGLDGPLTLGRMGALGDDAIFDYDTAEPIAQDVTTAPCVAPAVAPALASPLAVPSGKPGSGSPGTTTAAATARLLDTSVRRRSLRVRLSGRMTGVAVKLADRRGRTVARGRLARVDGAATLSLRPAKRLRRGAYVLSVQARSGLDRPITRTVRLR